VDRLNWVAQDCFNAIGQLARLAPHDPVDPALVHGRMRSYVDMLLRRAREAGFPEEDGRLMAYAVIALCDEVVLGGSGGLREFWAVQPLQLVYFGENTAGEDFFVRMEQVRQNPRQQDVLRVFYLCLMFGFRGRYAVRGGEVPLGDLTDSLRTQLMRSLPMPELLSPNGLRPEEGLLEVGRKLPVVWMALGVLALTGVLYLGLAVSLRGQLHSFVTWMNQVGGA
jgi:type VI secretion system protein ImpK